MKDDKKRASRRLLDYGSKHSAPQRDAGGASEEARRLLPPWNEWTEQLFAPFTYFGGKRKIVDDVWARFGKVPNYIEPFAGGLAVLLGRPVDDLAELDRYYERACDANYFLLNFWRAAKYASVHKFYEYYDFPGSEPEVLARRRTLIRRMARLQDTLKSNMKAYDVEMAANWLYIVRNWIGGGADDPAADPEEKMVTPKPPQIIGDSLKTHMKLLKARTRNVQFFDGHWRRPLESPSQTTNLGVTAVFLDPPYLGTEYVYGISEEEVANGDKDVFAELPNADRLCKEVTDGVAVEARDWAIEHGKDEQFRIAYCGYEGQGHDKYFDEAGGWTKSPGPPRTGRSKKGSVEIVWYSPGCLKPKTET